MNQLNQLGTRINLICNVFDKWIGQQDLNCNLFAVLYTLATEGSRTQKHRRRVESAQTDRFRRMQNPCRTRVD